MQPPPAEAPGDARTPSSAFRVGGVPEIVGYPYHHHHQHHQANQHQQLLHHTAPPSPTATHHQHLHFEKDLPTAAGDHTYQPYQQLGRRPSSYRSPHQNHAEVLPGAAAFFPDHSSQSPRRPTSETASSPLSSLSSRSSSPTKAPSTSGRPASSSGSRTSPRRTSSSSAAASGAPGSSASFQPRRFQSNERQVALFLQSFNVSDRLSKAERTRLAREATRLAEPGVTVTEKNVTVWFQNRRQTIREEAKGMVPKSQRYKKAREAAASASSSSTNSQTARAASAELDHYLREHILLETSSNVQLFRVSSLAIGTWLRNLTSSNPRSPDLVIYGKEGALVYYLSHADLGYQVTVRLESIINFSRVGVDGVVLEVSEAPEMATAVSVPAGDKQIRMRWEPVGDFTDGSASVVRVHSIQCSQTGQKDLMRFLEGSIGHARPSLHSVNPQLSPPSLTVLPSLPVPHPSSSSGSSLHPASPASPSAALDDPSVTPRGGHAIRGSPAPTLSRIQASQLPMSVRPSTSGGERRIVRPSPVNLRPSTSWELRGWSGDQRVGAPPSSASPYIGGSHSVQGGGFSEGWYGPSWPSSSQSFDMPPFAPYRAPPPSSALPYPSPASTSFAPPPFGSTSNTQPPSPFTTTSPMFQGDGSSNSHVPSGLGAYERPPSTSTSSFNGLDVNFEYDPFGASSIPGGAQSSIPTTAERSEAPFISWPPSSDPNNIADGNRGYRSPPDSADRPAFDTDTSTEPRQQQQPSAAAAGDQWPYGS